MVGKHKTSLLGWHPRSAELEAWIRAEAERRGSLADVLEDGMSAAMEASRPVAAKPPRAQPGQDKNGAEEKTQPRCPVKGWCDTHQTWHGKKG